VILRELADLSEEDKLRQVYLALLFSVVHHTWYACHNYKNSEIAEVVSGIANGDYKDECVRMANGILKKCS